MERERSLMDLQLFAEGDVPAAPAEPTPQANEPVQPTEPAAPETKPDYSQMSTDDINNMLNNYHNPKKAEPTEPNEPVEPKEPDAVEPTEPTEPEPTEPTTDGDPDLTQVFKIKENGQVKEYTLAQLIDRAQKGENYERRMQELAAQRKALEVQKPPEPAENPADKLANFNKRVTERAMQMLGLTDASEFQPDPSGLMGEQLHYLAYQQAIADIQNQDAAERSKQDAQSKEYGDNENRYTVLTETATAKKDFSKVAEYAVEKYKGMADVLKGSLLESALKKDYQRTLRNQGQAINVEPFTAGELDAYATFWDKAEKEFYAKQFTPKPVDKTKQPVKTEKSGDGQQPAPKKLTREDFKNMSKDDVNTVLNKYFAKQKG